jgi:CBS domain-containing protein
MSVGSMPIAPVDGTARGAADEPVDLVMSTSVVSVDENEDLLTALSLLRLGALRHLVVVDSQGRFAAVVSDRLLVDHCDGDPRRARLTRMKDVIFDADAVVPSGTTVIDAARRMLHHSAGAVAVVDDRSVVLGVVTGADLLRALVSAA